MKRIFLWIKISDKSGEELNTTVEMEMNDCTTSLDGPKADHTPDPTDHQPRTILHVWKKFGEDTSMHGLGRAVNNLRLWKKLIWSVLVLIAASMAARNLYLTFEDYTSYPVSTTVSLNNRHFMNFPAITLCNLNPYRLNYINESLRNIVLNNLKNGHSVKKQEELFHLHFNKMYNIYSMPPHLTHLMEEMFVDCMFDLIPCGVPEFVTRDNIKYGHCFTINHHKSYPQWISFRAGNKNGFILELDIQQMEYLPFTPSAGLKVVIHDPNVMPFPEEDGIVIRVGASTSIGLRKTTVERQVPPWGSCIRAEDATDPTLNMFQKSGIGYSETACQKTCYQMSVLEKCKCCDKNYPCSALALENTEEGQDLEIRDCDESDDMEFHCVNKVRKLYSLGLLSCMYICRPVCRETIFKTSYATASWPSNNYLDNLSIKAANASLRQTGIFQDPSNISTQYLQNNFVRLEVYYETLLEETIVATPSYNWNKLLSDVGGQLGLWMGFSLMTAIEFLELLWDIGVHLCCKIRYRRHDKTKRADV